MVMQLTAAEPVSVYRVMDGFGRAIGEVVQPRSRPVLGAGAGTVLLIRMDGGSATPRQVERSLTGGLFAAENLLLSVQQLQAPVDDHDFSPSNL